MPNILNRKILTAALAFIVLWLGHSAYQVYEQRKQVIAQLGDIQGKVDAVAQENQYLASSSAYFSSDEYLEREARLKLNYKPADEQVAFIYKDAASHSANGTASASFWQRWFGWFLKK